MAVGQTSAAIDAADPTTSPLDDQRGVARPQGAGPDIGAYEAARIGPTTSIELDPASPNGNNGWYVSTVLFAFGASDPDGAVAETRCALDPASTPASFADLPAGSCSLLGNGADGTHALYAASIDTDGNAEATVASAAFKVDKTAPTLSPSLNVTSVVVGQTGVEAVPNASDPTSGLASSSCEAVDTSLTGVQTIDCTATDNAGNVGAGSLTIVVEYRILGFFSPVPMSKWQAGMTVPIKVALGDLDGFRLGDAAAAALAANCRVTFSATGAQAVTGKCLRYDPKMDQLVFNWKLGKNPLGTTVLKVAISYPGSSTVTTLSEAITIVR